jgi:hypothetical protein
VIIKKIKGKDGTEIIEEVKIGKNGKKTSKFILLTY